MALDNDIKRRIFKRSNSYKSLLAYTKALETTSGFEFTEELGGKNGNYDKLECKADFKNKMFSLSFCWDNVQFNIDLKLDFRFKSTTYKVSKTEILIDGELQPYFNTCIAEKYRIRQSIKDENLSSVLDVFDILSIKEILFTFLKKKKYYSCLDWLENQKPELETSPNPQPEHNPTLEEVKQAIKKTDLYKSQTSSNKKIFESWGNDILSWMVYAKDCLVSGETIEIYKYYSMVNYLNLKQEVLALFGMIEHAYPNNGEDKQTVGIKRSQPIVETTVEHEPEVQQTDEPKQESTSGSGETKQEPTLKDVQYAITQTDWYKGATSDYKKMFESWAKDILVDVLYVKGRLENGATLELYKRESLTDYGKLQQEVLYFLGLSVSDYPKEEEPTFTPKVKDMTDLEDFKLSFFSFILNNSFSQYAELNLKQHRQVLEEVLKACSIGETVYPHFFGAVPEFQPLTFKEITDLKKRKPKSIFMYASFELLINTTLIEDKELVLLACQDKVPDEKIVECFCNKIKQTQSFKAWIYTNDLQDNQYTESELLRIATATLFYIYTVVSSEKKQNPTIIYLSKQMPHYRVISNIFCELLEPFKESSKKVIIEGSKAHSQQMLDELRDMPIPFTGGKTVEQIDSIDLDNIRNAMSVGYAEIQDQQIEYKTNPKPNSKPLFLSMDDKASLYNDLLDETDEEKQKQALDFVFDEVDRLERSVKSLLSKVELLNNSTKNIIAPKYNKDV